MENCSLWVGGAYIPGPSDQRFRALQGEGTIDHFQYLREELATKGKEYWFCGGDINAITATAQPSWGTAEPLDFHSQPAAPPLRASQDKRKTNAHGQRFLRA